MEAVGQLTGGVAHDFNNLLTVIVGNLNIAQRHLDSLTEVPAERLRRVINNAMRGAERATTITKHLLAFSRKEPPDPKPLNINKLVHGFSDFLRRTLGETITLDIVGADGLWRAEADPVQLEAAILNLAVNARDAMAAGGKLTISTKNTFLDEKYCRQYDELVPGSYVRIAVSDTGTGMSKDILKRVFEPFFTTKKAGQGTGLGLSQVYGFVKQSRGHVEIDSEPGRGTTVMIYLPALPANVREEPTMEREVTGADMRPDDPARRGRSRCPRLCGRDPSRALPCAGNARRGFGARHDRSQRRAGGLASSRPRLAGNERRPARRAGEGAPAAGEGVVHDRLFARHHRSAMARRCRHRDAAQAAGAGRSRAWAASGAGRSERLTSDDVAEPCVHQAR